MRTLLVTDAPDKWQFAKEYAEIICASDYISQAYNDAGSSIRVINLCESFKYQMLGYYVSLLAQARAHKVLPTVTTIQDLKNKTIAKVISEEIDKDIQYFLKDIKGADFVLSVYFGKNLAKKYELLSKKLHQLFPAPLFRIEFHHQKKWVIKNIYPISINQVPKEHLPFMEDAAIHYFTKKRFRHAKKHQRPYDLAILVNEDEKMPPSDAKAIKKFLDAAEGQGFNAYLIEKNDFKSLSEFDALLIRETTSVNHHTYRFARKAMAEGMPVIDEPNAILKCANKVYLSELMQKLKIKTPETKIVSKVNFANIINSVKFPSVLKLPDSAFSFGVVKVSNKEELIAEIEKFWKESELVILQEFLPSDFDWRIGILEGEPLFACQYFMAKDHWQIYNWSDNNNKEGLYKTFDPKDVPKHVIDTALKAAKPIGNSLYGVDIKAINGDVYVIEINDNPSIEAGVEDKVLGDKLYQSIISKLWCDLRRIHGNE